MKINTNLTGIWKPFARQADFRNKMPLHSIPSGKGATLFFNSDGTGYYDNEKKPLFGSKRADFSYEYLGDYAWELSWRGGRAHGDVFGIFAGGPLGEMSILLVDTPADLEAREVINNKETAMLVFTSLPPKGQAMYYYKV